MAPPDRQEHSAEELDLPKEDRGHGEEGWAQLCGSQPGADPLLISEQKGGWSGWFLAGWQAGRRAGQCPGGLGGTHSGLAPAKVDGEICLE